MAMSRAAQSRAKATVFFVFNDLNKKTRSYMKHMYILLNIL